MITKDEILQQIASAGKFSGRKDLERTLIALSYSQQDLQFLKKNVGILIELVMRDRKQKRSNREQKNKPRN